MEHMENTSICRRPGFERRVEERGETLSPRQEQVLSALKAGLSERQAADILGLSPHTVHSHVKEVYVRMGVKSRAQIVEPVDRRVTGNRKRQRFVLRGISTVKLNRTKNHAAAPAPAFADAGLRGLYNPQPRRFGRVPYCAIARPQAPEHLALDLPGRFCVRINL